MFNRVLVMSGLLTAGLVGCSLNRHHECGCGEHGRVRNVVRHHAESNACTCTPPLFPGDQGCQSNCRQHARQRPLSRMATRFRRSAPSWFRGPHGHNCDCGACGTASYCESQFPDVLFVPGAGMCPQTVCSQPGWDAGGTCGCDSCSSAMMSNWQIDATFSSDAYSAMPGPSSCGCGEHVAPDTTPFSADGSWEYSHPHNSPLMDGQINQPPGGDARTFAPSGPHVLPLPPDSSSTPAPIPLADPEPAPMPMPMPMPMPQDLTPPDSDSASPKNPLFDPLSEEGAPAAESPLDPASYELPLLPPLPVPDHASSGKRVALPYAQSMPEF